MERQVVYFSGMLYHECVQIYHEGFSSYSSSLYNLMDYALLMVYTCSFSLMYIVMFKVSGVYIVMFKVS